MEIMHTFVRCNTSQRMNNFKLTENQQCPLVSLVGAEIWTSTGGSANRDGDDSG